MNKVSAAAIENLSKGAGNLLLARLLGVAAGTWITLSLMSIQVAIFALDDNALEKWCKNSPFGLDASGSDAFKDPEKMSSSLESAIYEVK